MLQILDQFQRLVSARCSVRMEKIFYFTVVLQAVFVLADDKAIRCPQIININRGTYSLEDTCVSQDDIREENKQLLSNLTEIIAIRDSSSDSSCLRLKPRDCQDIQKLGHKTTGVYTIHPASGINAIRVRCNMDTIPGGWTVVQRRISSSDFYKTWNEYQIGFGDLNDNFWLGNQQIHLISSQGWYFLRVDLTSFDGEHRYAEYKVFSVGDVESQYKLVVDGYNGTAGDSLTYQSGMKFSTKDRDNDQWSYNCAQNFTGAWWHNACHNSNLNGEYGNNEYGKGPNWYHWKGHNYALKTTEMKIRHWN